MTEQEWWRCPHCDEAHPAFAFALVARFGPGVRPGRRRRCPGCETVTPEGDLLRIDPPDDSPQTG